MAVLVGSIYINYRAETGLLEENSYIFHLLSEMERWVLSLANMESELRGLIIQGTDGDVSLFEHQQEVYNRRYDRLMEMTEGDPAHRGPIQEIHSIVQGWLQSEAAPIVEMSRAGTLSLSSIDSSADGQRLNAAEVLYEAPLKT